MVIAFLGLTSRASWILRAGSAVEHFASGKEFKAEFEVEGAVSISGAEGFGENVPMDGFNGVIAPLESLSEIRF
jgi:hypothetical protein